MYKIMSSIKTKVKTYKKKGRPRIYNTHEEKKQMLKNRSRAYYSDPEKLEIQRLRMAQYRIKNKAKISERTSRRKRLKTIEKRLTDIWIKKGLLEIVSKLK